MISKGRLEEKDKQILTKYLKNERQELQLRI